MIRISSGRIALSALALAIGSGCGDGSEPADVNAGNGGGGNQNETRVLKVASSWFSASEQEALQVTLTAFQEETGASVEVVALEQGQAERTAQYQSNAWDVGQENFYNLSNSFDDGNGGLTALDLSAEGALEDGLANVFPNVLSALDVQGQILGFPMNLHRENTLHYSKSLMPNPPTSLAELRQICDDYVTAGSAGPKPLAIASADWLYRILFQAMLPAPVVGGSSDNPRPAFLAAGEVIQHYLESDCLWVAPSEHGWQEAAQALIDGDAAMYIHGDWAKGYMVQLGWTPGVDFDVVPAPGSEGAFYYGIDTFAVNKSSPRLDLAIQFAKIAMTNAVQAGFSERKGSTPAIVFEDADGAFSDPSLRTTYAHLSAGMANGTALPVPPWMGNEGGALMVPLRDGEKTADQVATDFMTVYPASN